MQYKHKYNNIIFIITVINLLTHKETRLLYQYMYYMISMPHQQSFQKSTSLIHTITFWKTIFC